MHKGTKLFLSSLVLVLLFGCAKSNVKFFGFEEGKTSRQDVKLVLGEPDKVTQEGEEEIWTYYYAKKELEQSKREVMELSVIFKGGFFSDYKLAMSKKVVEQGRERNFRPRPVRPRPRPPVRRW